jgi:GNAT superfamily N-acetyltransferase
VTADRELIRLELDNQVAGNRAFLAGDRAVMERYGTSFETVSGLSCSTCAAWEYPLFNRVIGAGVLAPLDDRDLERVAAHYEAKGRTCNVEVYEDLTPPELIALLERAGLRSSGHGLEAHVLETDREVAPRATPAAVRKIGPDEFAHFGELVRDGFDMTGGGLLAEFFVDLTVASMRALGDAGAAFIASVDGQDAGTGQLAMTERVAGCYSGSVLERFRGRGIQHALVAARVAEGLRRGRRIFISQTDPDSPSGHNLHDVGFRTLYRATWYTRPA